MTHDRGGDAGATGAVSRSEGLLGAVLDSMLDPLAVLEPVRDERREVDGERAFFGRDDGAGFDPAFGGQPFQPFHRLHPDDEFPGTGIGPAMVQRVVTRLGGRCWAEGEPGRGATFFFTLPEA